MEARHTCLLCGQPVLREGSECFDCRRSRPEVLRQETRTDERRRAPLVGKAIAATAAVAVAVFLVGLADFGAPELAWRHATHAPVTSMAAAAGVGVVVGTERGEVVALDELTGERRWHVSATDGTVRALTTLDGRVYFSVGDSMAYAVDLRTGRVDWDFRTGAACTALAFDRRHVLLALPDRIVAVEREDGRPAWRYHLPARLEASALVTQPGMAWIGYREDPSGRGDRGGRGGDRSEAGSDGTDRDGADRDGGGVLALDLDTRVPRWQTDLRAAVATPPVLATGTLVVLTTANRLVALDAHTGNVRWRRDGVDLAPAARDEVLVAATPGAFLAFDAASGSEVWSTPHELAGRGAAVVQEASVFFVARREIRALRRKTGRQRWAQTFDDDLCPVLAFAGGWMYAATRLGDVCALRMP
jgi:outer membrane protein assembly factor BamB